MEIVNATDVAVAVVDATAITDLLRTMPTPDASLEDQAAWLQRIEQRD